MSKMYNDIVERLNNKKEELAKLQEQFKVMCHNDMQSPCFEQNAIHSLIVIQRLKSEIEELEYREMCENTNNKCRLMSIKCCFYEDVMYEKVYKTKM